MPKKGSESAKEVIRVADEYYILATSPRVDDRTRVLKNGETFAVLDRYGDIDPFGGGELGLYHEGTRFVSRLSLRLDDGRPFLLSSTVKEKNDLLAVDLTNHDVSDETGIALPRGSVHVFRSVVLWGATCYQRLRVRNYGLVRARLPLVLQFDADFADIFEVRGLRRARRGERGPDEIGEEEATLVYRGLDGRIRRSRFRWSPRPAALGPGEARFELDLEPREEIELYLAVGCETDGPAARPAPGSYDAAVGAVERALAERAAGACHIYTSNEQFNDWIQRSKADLHMMLTETEHGLYPYAGVPWFSTAFGRDGLVTALETLWLQPDIARGVLRYLAATQATELDPDKDAEPGKILHETRRGEMASLGEIPFGRYYGTIDATPLFVVLADAYVRWTGDLALAEELWPSVEAALAWIDDYGDVDGDGFVEYAPKARQGLVNQGWKDSADSVFHADGRLAEGPIALVEVQAYVYRARRGAARLAARLGRRGLAERLEARAEELRQRFEEAFWSEELGTYALALDGAKRPCLVRTSNPGHALFAGIAAPERARRVAATLLDPSSFSGWGVRTVAATESRFNPMSYHNGSVWPHDNALIADGLARYELKEEALRILTGLFDASLFVDLHRLPELFCGFVRRPGEGPTLYPLACAPQSWAAASVFLLLRACLGLAVDGARRRLRLVRPLLPPSLQRVEIEGLRVGTGRVDLRLDRYERDTGVEVERREGDVEVVVVK